MASDAPGRQRPAASPRPVPYTAAVDDADLARRAQAGDMAAWADIYDRYADRLHDYCWSILRDRHEAEDALQDAFVTAAAKVGQLRDPERLRPWLYAVCRTSALARTRRRARVTPTDDLDGAAPAAEERMPGETAQLQQIVWAAAGGLAARDRAVLELHLRHGLVGQELADALEISSHHATVLLSRVRDAVERSLGALLVGRTGRRDCPDLDALLTGWDGTLSPLLRKQVARHIDRCEVCTECRRRVVSPLALLAAMPLVPAPTGLRERVLGELEHVSASRPLTRRSPGPRRGARWPLAAAVAAVAALVAAAVLLTSGGEGDRLAAQRTATDEAGPSSSSPRTSAPAATTTTTAATTSSAAELAAAPARITIDATSVDFGASGSAATAPLRNDGGQALVWRVTTTLPGLAVTPTSGRLAPGATTLLDLTLDRGALGEGSHTGGVTVSGTSEVSRDRVTARSLEVAALVDRVPVLGAPVTDRATISFNDPACRTAVASIAVADESPVTVVLTWRRATGTSTDVPMTPGAGGSYAAQIGPVASPSDGPVTWWVTATDARGNLARSPDATVGVGASC